MSANRYSFKIDWSEEDQEYVTTCPSFPGLSAFGKTEEESLAEAKIALGLFVESCEAHSIPLPDSRMDKKRAIQYLDDATDRFFQAKPRRKTCTADDIFDYLELCPDDVRRVCEALDARCGEGETDPNHCFAVFVDAYNKYIVEEELEV